MRLLPFVVPDELVHGAPLALWKALFDVAWPGCDARLRSHDDVLRALASPVSTALSRALGDVLSLGRDPGREALLDALVDRGLDLASFSRTDGATSLALRVVAGAVGAPDGPLAGVVERARAYVHYHDTDERSVLVFRAAERRPLPEDIGARVSRIAGEVAAWCEKYGRLAWAEARSLGPGPGPFGPGTVRVIVRRPDRPTSVPVLDEHGELRVLGGHPLATDALYFDAAGTRFAVATRAPRIAALYRRAAGRALFDEVGYFGNAAVFTLAPLVGMDALRAPLVAAEVSDTRVVALGWDTGHNESVRIAGRDCLEAIQRDGHVLAGREISYAKLRVTLVNGRRTSLELWPPHRARLPRGNEDVAWRLIEALRLTRGAGEAADVWALDPWVHARATWAALAGNVEALVSEDVLVATQRRVAAHPAHPAAGRALLALPLETEPGSFYGVSLLADVPSRTLAPGELDALALDPLALGRRFARAGGLTGRVREIARYGLYDLGTRPLGPDARVRVLLVLRDPRRDAGTIAADLTERFARDRVVALVPRGRSAGLGVPELAFDGLAPPGDLVPALASALHIDAAIDPLSVAPSTARLVLDARGQRAWLDGVLLARLSDLHVKLLLALARSGGEPVSGKDLDARIAPRRGGGVARDAKYLLGETVRKSFELVGKAPPADTDELIVRVGKKGYRLGVDAFVLSGSAPTKAR